MSKRDYRPIYFPAIAHQTSGYFDLSDEAMKSLSPNIIKSPRFFNDTDNYFSHPYTLWNAFDHSKFPKLREQKKIDDNCLVFLDSGGYQISTGRVDESKYTNEIALEWCLNNGNIFPIIDRPIAGEIAKSFNESLDKTIESAEYYEKHRTSKAPKILNVLQARGKKDVEKWYEQIKHVKLDGWAIGGYGGSMVTVLHAIRYLYKNGEFDRKSKMYFHIFGTSSFENMLYIARIQQQLNELPKCNVQLTYDSSTASKASASGGFFRNEYGSAGLLDISTSTSKTLSKFYDSEQKMSQVYFSNTIDYKKVKKNTKLPIPYSPISAGISDAKKFLNTSNSKNKKAFYILGYLHNLWMMLQFKEFYENLVFLDQDEVFFNSISREKKFNISLIDGVFKNIDKPLPDVHTREALDEFDNPPRKLN
jgi:hypothetical protein